MSDTRGAGYGETRRSAARSIASASALLPFAALRADPAQARGKAARAVPQGRFRLERILTRGLVGGQAIVVTRRWEIVFAATGSGMTVRGGQIFADVDAPAVLSQLAALEAGRTASALFPLALDRAGLIVPRTADAVGPQLVRAIDTARALFASLPATAPDRDQTAAFMAGLGRVSASAVSQLPRDLFYPVPGTRGDARAVDLPDGRKGSIAVRTSAAIDPPSGLLQSCERRVVTRLSDEERVTAERWDLARAG